MERWYAMHTKTQYERRAAELLQQNEILTFLPEIPVIRERASNEQQPLFPGYIFVRLDLQERSSSDWRWVTGVRYLVGYGETPVPLPEQVIAMLASQVAEMQENPLAIPAELRLQRGDKVRIKEGPFAGLVGILNSRYTPEKRVEILLQAMQGAMRVRIAASSLERVEPERDRKQKRGRTTRGRGRPIRNS